MKRTRKKDHFPPEPEPGPAKDPDWTVDEDESPTTLPPGPPGPPEPQPEQ